MEDWRPMKEVAEMLNISYYKLQRLVDRGTVTSKEDPLDRRYKLVNVEEVKKVFRIRA